MAAEVHGANLVVVYREQTDGTAEVHGANTLIVYEQAFGTAEVHGANLSIIYTHEDAYSGAFTGWGIPWR